MTKQTINYGAAGSGSGGDTARTALQKLEANFNEIFSNAGSAANAKALNELSGVADRLPYFSGVGVLSLATLTARARTLLAAGNQDGQLAALGLRDFSTSISLAGVYTGAIEVISATPYIDFRDGLTEDFDFRIIRATNDAVNLTFYDGTTYYVAIDRFSPAQDGAKMLGNPSGRWSVLYAASGTINTSDAREKTAVRALTDGEITAARQLAQEIGAYKFLAAVAEKGTAAREHIGMTVQRAIEILQANGLEPFNYGFICYDSWPQVTVDHPATYEQVPVTDADGNVTGYENGALIKEAWTEVTQEAGDRYSFRTDELNLFIARGQAAYLAQLEARIAALEPTT